MRGGVVRVAIEPPVKLAERLIGGRRLFGARRLYRFWLDRLCSNNRRL
jgi:hypothetical protein